MNLNIPKRRNMSTLPVSSSYGNWFTQRQVNPSFVSYKSTKLTQASLFETVNTNPQKGNDEEKEPSRMRRTYSAFKNSQSRVTTMKDKVFDLSHQVNLLKQKTKRTRLDLELSSEQLTYELKQRETEMKKNILSLQKLVKGIIKGDQTRTQEIKNETLLIKQSYNSIKQQLLSVHERLAVVEKECGFMTFASKLKH